MDNTGKKAERLVLIRPLCRDAAKTRRLDDVLQFGLEGSDYEVIETADEMMDVDLRNRRIFFAIELGESGINLEYVRMLKMIRLHTSMFDGSTGGVLTDGNSDLFTKSVSRHLVFSANRAGCAFPGRPLVEGTATLYNFNTVAKNLHMDNYSAYKHQVRELVDRIMTTRPAGHERPKLLVLHAGIESTSNTLCLWDMVEKGLDADIRRISLRDGDLHDCRGCAYETCLHFGEESKCFYGGQIPQEVYPAILECDGLVMLCPNYNDALSANLTAFINRLTALFRVHQFYDKSLYAVIVSGYSGGDIIAEQLISALNMNKTFYLPPRFALMKIANDPSSILDVSGIEEDAAAFARQMMGQLRWTGGTPE